jgi:hypothetical protein
MMHKLHFSLILRVGEAAYIFVFFRGRSITTFENPYLKQSFVTKHTHVLFLKISLASGPCYMKLVSKKESTMMPYLDKIIHMRKEIIYFHLKYTFTDML